MNYYRVRVGGADWYAMPERDGSSDEPPERFRLLDGPPFAGGEPTGELADAAAAALLPPATPTLIVCVARNFAAHAAERDRRITEEPLVFLKPPSAVIPSGAPIVRPAECELLNCEGELAVVMGRKSRHLSEEEALDHVWGYTCFNDVTARDIQDREGTFTRGKGYDTFAPLGPSVRTGLRPESTVIETRVNGEEVQRGAVADLVHPVPRLLAFVSSIMTLRPGDVIATGTPAGMRPVEPGDQVEVSIAGIGRLRNPVVADQSRRPAAR